MENQRNISGEDKKAAVSSMFDSIAGSYDFLNHFLSFGVDRRWRNKAVRIISDSYKRPKILDVATGTADLPFAALRIDPEHITGIDISLKMLGIGKDKIRRKGLSDRIDLIHGDSENIPFNDDTFDVAMVTFGVRNFADPLKGLSEMRRVIRTGGMVLVLEFSKPVRFPFKQLYNFYFLNILPIAGKIFSRNARAYRYLPESVMQFPDKELVIDIMKATGLADIKQFILSGGIATIYTGLKS